MKIILFVLTIIFVTCVHAQTAGDEEALAMLEEANRYMDLANSSGGSERSLNFRRAATAANLACNYADSAALRAHICDQAQRMNSLVTFD